MIPDPGNVTLLTDDDQLRNLSDRSSIFVSRSPRRIGHSIGSFPFLCSMMSLSEL